MVLTESASYTERPQGLSSFIILPGETIFNGALVALGNGTADDGRAFNWHDATLTSHFFMGIARITEATGQSAEDGEAKTGNSTLTEEVAVDTSGVILRAVTVTGATALELGSLVFSDNEDAFQIVATGGGHPIGWISRHYTGEIVDLKLFSAGAYRAFNNI